MSCIVHETGTVSCFGSSSYAALGNGSRDSSLVPVEVTGLTNVAQVSSGSSVTCARQNSGVVWCWGSGSNGSLGNGTEERALTPIQVSGINNAIDISVYGGSVCAVLEDRTVSCWGSGEHGALGNGTTGDRTFFSNVPVPVSDISDATQVSVGTGFACALRLEGAVSCWGYNRSGQGGFNDTEVEETTTPREVFVDPANTVVAGYGQRTEIACGRGFCLSLHADGHVSGWGSAPGFGSGSFGGLVSSRSPKPEAIPFIDLTE